MKDINNVKRVFEEYGGIMKTGQLEKEKIYFKDIQYLVSEGYVDKIRYGYYQWMDEYYSEAVTVSRLFPDGIFCLDTAMFYHGYCDRIPVQWNIAVDKDSSKSRFDVEYPFVKPFYVEPSILNLGLTEMEIDGEKIQIYDRERVICDCIRYRNKIDREGFTQAIRTYVDDPMKDINKLMDYASILRTAGAVRDLVGIWL